jgi:SAM-dependent methyltransferase
MPEAWRSNWSMPAGSGERWAEDYERGRPGWPRDVLDIVEAARGKVLDLGAGTGKLTGLLASAFDRVVAVEPSDAMRRILAERCPSVHALAGSAEVIPLADATVDLVYAAQAFHTFDNARALPEIARVLHSDGAVVLLWNLPAGPWQPSTASAEELLSERMPEVDYIPLDLGGPSASSGWQPTGAASLFETFQATAFANPQTLDREGLVAFYSTMGWLADLADEERLPMLNGVRARLDGDTYQRAWETHAHWAHRRGM